MGRLLVGAVLIIVGLNALLGLNLWDYFWPALLIILGVWLLIGRPGNTHHHFQEGEGVEEGKNHFSYSATFQGIDKKIVTDDFRGGKVESVFGGVNLDLREAKIKTKEPVILKIETNFGGVKVMVPKSWRVENNIRGFASGVHDSTVHPSEKELSGVLKIEGSATVGGVEIIN